MLNEYATLGQALKQFRAGSDVCFWPHPARCGWGSHFKIAASHGEQDYLPDTCRSRTLTTDPNRSVHATGKDVLPPLQFARNALRSRLTSACSAFTGAASGAGASAPHAAG